MKRNVHVVVVVVVVVAVVEQFNVLCVLTNYKHFLVNSRAQLYDTCEHCGQPVPDSLRV